jgi:hypothetical protein
MYSVQIIEDVNAAGMQGLAEFVSEGDHPADAGDARNKTNARCLGSHISNPG